MISILFVILFLLVIAFFTAIPILLICYLADKDFADYDLLWGNFNLYNLLHSRKMK